jgi:hypothetical protein
VAVAAAKQVKERNETVGLAVGLVVAGVAGVFVVLRFIKEAGEASAAANRPKQPWDI